MFDLCDELISRTQDSLITSFGLMISKIYFFTAAFIKRCVVSEHF
jgi:hypothetical protein